MLLLTVVNMYKHMAKVVIKSLQGGEVTRTVLDANFLWFPMVPISYVPQIMKIGWQYTKLLQK